MDQTALKMHQAHFHFRFLYHVDVVVDFVVTVSGVFDRPTVDERDGEYQRCLHQRTCWRFPRGSLLARNGIGGTLIAMIAEQIGYCQALPQ